MESNVTKERADFLNAYDLQSDCFSFQFICWSQFYTRLHNYGE